MNPDRDADFARRLDDEWLRRRIATVVAPLDAAEEARLASALIDADPLGDDVPARTPAAAWRELWRSWPARFVLAGAACAMLAVGVFVGSWFARPGPAVTATAVALPAYVPQPPGSALGLGGGVNAASRDKFAAAMSHYGQPDFVARALPDLRDAVAADGSNDEAQFWLGVVRLRAGAATDAVAPLEAAVALAPARAVYKDYLLFAYLQTGNVTRAMRLQGERLRAPAR